MDLQVSDIDNDSACVVGPNDAPFRLRPYQAEMVDASLNSNIIVVMDTGSGKTHIAVDRARAELEICSPDQLIWFLAPTVTLCEQQYELFKSLLPGFGVQLLSGDDGVDHWTQQSVWDAILLNIRITVSTHQVLLDALTHGFVKISKLALLIFDEAHHCTGNHPAHRIMSDFYKPGSDSLPKILGLSASPVMKAAASTRDLQQIEKNLQAIAKTPKIHRSDLIRYVHKPKLVQVLYEARPETVVCSDLYLALKDAYINYDILKDPYVSDLLKQRREGYDVSKLLQKALESQKTYCSDQLRTLVSKARDMADELGSSAMEWYLHQCMAKFESTVHVSNQQLLDLSSDEKHYLLRILRRLPWREATLHRPMDLSTVSKKVDLLIDILVAEIRGNSEFTGLVFVEQRVWVATLANILSVHPRTKELFRVGTYVGSSNFSKRKAMIAAFAEPKNQQTTLNDFRAGTTNLILATSVLEEGIDVSNCHLVICFERPKNLKSFVQRRGRARKQKSKYFIFVPDTGVARSSEPWESLEAAMKASYENDMREVEQAERREQEDEHGERSFRVLKTGALLTLDNAMQHLNHFCASLRLGAYVNTTPQFEFFETQSGGVTARVTLPISLDPAVRSANSLESWSTERLARKDAAFEAYRALHLAGLVNDNLLPLAQEENEQAAKCRLPDYRPSMVLVSPTFDPWPLVAQNHREKPQQWYRCLIEISTYREGPMRMVLFTPGPMPANQEIPLHWNKSTLYSACSSCLPGTVLREEEVQSLRSITWKVLRSVFQIEEGRNDFLWLLAPCDPAGHQLNSEEISDWQSSTEGCQPAIDLVKRGCQTIRKWGLVAHQDQKYMLQSLNCSQDPNDLYLEKTRLQLIRLPKRRDFLHPVPDDQNKNDAYTRVEDLPAIECRASNLPLSYSIFALLFPSIIYRFEVHLIADALRTTLLKPVAFETSHLHVLVTAISSPATGEDDNYERLEFLGDTILKFVASIHLMGKELSWPESYLTGTKGRLVSNAFLSRAALASGLDRYIITKRFTGAKWKPRYVSQTVLGENSLQKEEKSSKLVADIVESLIGASYLVGGIEKAFVCIQTLLPLESWIPVDVATQTLQEAAHDLHHPHNLNIVEELAGRTFTNKSLLLEALTHASYNGPNAHSYERLEFLGDAVLDYVVTKRLLTRKLSHQTMHLIKSAMVTASFLAYSMFELTVAEETTNKLTLQPEVHHRALWQFLRGENHQLVAARDTALRQHMNARNQITAALERDAMYPWHLLALCDAPKFLSDIVESVIGAIYVDSRGDIAACELFIGRLGILDRLDRIVRDDVDVTHPKVRLGILAVEKKVKYVRVTDNLESNVNANRMYKCHVEVGQEKIGGVVQGLKKANAETIAAWCAAAILEQGEDTDMEDEFFDADEGGGVIVEDRS